MAPKFLLKLFLAFLILLWIAGIVFVARNFSLLDEYRLAGVFIIALILMPFMIMGVWLEVPDRPTWHEAWRLFFKFWVALAAIFIGFCGGLWVLLILLRMIWPEWLPPWLNWLELPIYIILLTWYVAGLLKVYTWLATRIQEW